MSTTTPLPTLPQPAADYLSAVTEALADLPDGEREDLIEEVGAHLADVAEEIGSGLDASSLRLRLGTPQAYAAELRAAAGYDAEPPPRAGVLTRLGAGGRVRAARLSGAIERLPGGAGVRRLLVELRPGWWVVRAWVLLTWLSLDRGISVVPPVTGNLLVDLALVVVVLFGSVWLGRRVTAADQARGWRLAAITANVILVVGCVPVYATIQSSASSGTQFAYPAPAASAFVSGPGDATNLFAFTPDGKLIPDFYLYDQSGQPVDLGDDSGCTDPSSPSALPFDNHYPRQQYTQSTDAGGNVTADCVPAGRAPGFSVAIPSASPASPPSTSAGPSTSAAPSLAPSPSPSPSLKQSPRPIPTASTR
jgi:hypothetical protein